MPEETLPTTPPEKLAEEPIPMLDVHPAPHAAHTWKDFFIHIATICIGLLIAIGLEQTVEYFHHRHQVAEARSRLAEERDANRLVIERDLQYAANVQTELTADLALLYQRQSNPKTPLKGRLQYIWDFSPMADGAWQSARANGVLAYLPDQELALYTLRYFEIEQGVHAVSAFIEQMDIAAAIAQRAPEADLSPADVHDLMQATSEAKGKLTLAQQFLQYTHDLALGDRPAPSQADGPIQPGEVSPGVQAVPVRH